VSFKEPANDITNHETLKYVLKNQYHAALAMLRETLERCSEDIWSSTEHLNSFWQVAYHTLFLCTSIPSAE